MQNRTSSLTYARTNAARLTPSLPQSFCLEFDQKLSMDSDMSSNSFESEGRSRLRSKIASLKSLIVTARRRALPSLIHVGRTLGDHNLRTNPPDATCLELRIRDTTSLSHQGH